MPDIGGRSRGSGQAWGAWTENRLAGLASPPPPKPHARGPEKRPDDEAGGFGNRFKIHIHGVVQLGVWVFQRNGETINLAGETAGPSRCSGKGEV